MSKNWAKRKSACEHAQNVRIQRILHLCNMRSLIRAFVEISKFNANSVDPDQTPRSVASDLGLHCLPMSL